MSQKCQWRTWTLTANWCASAWLAQASRPTDTDQRFIEALASQAMLIPDESVVNDQTRQVAYVVGEDGVVGQRTIEVGRLIEDMRVVRAGLAPTDRVIISGVQRARPGRKVTAEAGQMSAFPSGVSRGENAKLEMPTVAGGSTQ